jgi:hypothetical protein
VPQIHLPDRFLVPVILKQKKQKRPIVFNKKPNETHSLNVTVTRISQFLPEDMPQEKFSYKILPHEMQEDDKSDEDLLATQTYTNHDYATHYLSKQ